MITVFGDGRGFRVVWLLEEMTSRNPSIHKSLGRQGGGRQMTLRRDLPRRGRYSAARRPG